MVEKNVCSYNKFGYCKFGNKCFRIHENKLCENVGCEVEKCPLRHPRMCRFFLDYNYCKFGTFCRFKHEANAKGEALKEIEKLKRNLEIIKQEIVEKENEIEIREDQIKKLEAKNKDLETENEVLKQKVKDLLGNLEHSNNEAAVNHMLHLDFKERVTEKYGYDSNDEESDYEPDDEVRLTNRVNFRMMKVEELRKQIKGQIHNKCDICEFTSKSEGGLKTHKTKKHKEV